MTKRSAENDRAAPIHGTMEDWSGEGKKKNKIKIRKEERQIERKKRKRKKQKRKDRIRSKNKYQSINSILVTLKTCCIFFFFFFFFFFVILFFFFSILPFPWWLHLQRDRSINQTYGIDGWALYITNRRQGLGVRTHDTAYYGVLGQPISAPSPTDNGLAHACLGSVPDRKTGATETVRKKATAILI